MKNTLRHFFGFAIWASLSWVPLGLHRIWMEGRTSDWWMYPVAAVLPVVATFAAGLDVIPPALLPLVAFFSLMPYLVLAIDDGLRFFRFRNGYRGASDAQ